MILVTGGTGLVGSHLLYALVKRGAHIRASVRAKSSLNDVRLAFSFYEDDPEYLINQIEWVQADLLNPASVDELFRDGITKVFHCAAMVSYQPRDKYRMISENTNIAANLVNSSLEAGVDHFIHVSSVAAIGRDAKNKAPLNEDNFWKNDPTNSNYAISKYLSENEVWRGIEEGLSAAIVNPAIILGPGNWNNSSNVIFKNFSKYFPFYSKGSAAFVDVRDVVDVMLQLSDRSITEERYILAGSNRPFREMFSKIAESFQVKQPSYPVSALMAGLIWRFEFVRSLLTGSKPLLTKETVAASASNWTYDTSKVQNDLGFSFRNLDHSIPEFVKFYQKTQLSRD